MKHGITIKPDICTEHDLPWALRCCDFPSQREITKWKGKNMSSVEHGWSQLSRRMFFYKNLWKEQNYYFPKTEKITCRMGQLVKTVTLCRINPDFQLACRNLCLKKVFQKQAALLKSSLEFTTRKAEWGEDSQPHPFRTLVHITKKPIFIMKWHIGRSHLYKAFFLQLAWIIYSK